MKGEFVKQVLKDNGFALNVVAESMGETPQYLQSLLRTSDIKTGVLERIAKAVNKSIYFFFENYQAEDKFSVSADDSFVKNQPIGESSDVSRLISLLEQKDVQIGQLMGMLESQMEINKKILVPADDHAGCVVAE